MSAVWVIFTWFELILVSMPQFYLHKGLSVLVKFTLFPAALMIDKHQLLAIKSFPLLLNVASREASRHLWGCFLGGVKVFTPAVSQLCLSSCHLGL